MQLLDAEKGGACHVCTLAELQQHKARSAKLSIPEVPFYYLFKLYVSVAVYTIMHLNPEVASVPSCISLL